MTLVVGCRTEDGLLLVADTKLTYRENERRTAEEVLSNPLNKLIALSNDLVVGFAGVDPHTHLEALVELRGRATDSVLDYAIRQSDAGFVVAELSSNQIWQVDRGQVDVIAGNDLAWVGDDAALALFRENLKRWDEEGAPRDYGVNFALSHLVISGGVKSVGGYMISAHGRQGQFRFTGMLGARVFPGESTARLLEKGLTSSDGNTVQEYQILFGAGDTYGASAFLFTNGNRAGLYRHERPWIPITLRCSTREQVIEMAMSHHDQMLV